MMQIEFNDYKRLNTSYLAKWIKKLGLERLKIGVCYEDPDIPCINTSYIKCSTEEHGFLIVCKYPVSKYALIHELGHLYIFTQLNITESITLNIIKDSTIKSFNNGENFTPAILDCFVDYRLCQFQEFYDSFIEYREEDIKKDRKVEGNTFKGNFKMYLHVYIESNFLFKKEAKTRLKTYIKRHLKTLRDNAIISSKGENKKLCYQDFQKLDQVLNRFGKIKNTTDPNDICSFFDSVMAIIK